MQNLFHLYKKTILVPCSTSDFTGRYQDNNGNRIKISKYTANYFYGAHQISGPDPPIIGTLEGDCTGLVNFPFLGGVQPIEYDPTDCSITMSSTGEVHRTRDSCNAWIFVIKVTLFKNLFSLVVHAILENVEDLHFIILPVIQGHSGLAKIVN